jgi:uncharacterized protein (TIGR03437 family)
MFVGPQSASNPVIALAVDPRDNSTVFAAAPGGGVWKTQDGGTTWTSLFDAQASLQVCSLAVDPRSPDFVYAGTGDGQNPRPMQGVARSADGGRTWAPFARITNRPVCALAVDPTNSAKVLAGSAEGLFVSSDFGSTWTKALSLPITSIAFGDSGVAYVGMLGDLTAGLRSRILTRSADGGRTWTDIGLPRNPGAPDAVTTSVAVRISGSSVLVAVSYQSTPAAQVDFYAGDGSQWIPTFGLGPARPPLAIAVDPNNRLFLAGENLISSTDGGNTWSIVPTIGRNFHAAAFSAGQLLLAGESGLESVSIGGAGREISPIPAPQVLAVSIDATQRIWAAGPGGLFGLYPGSPYATTGVPGIGPVGNVASIVAGSSSIFTAGADAVFESIDRGANFVSQTVIPEDEPRASFPPLVVDPIVPYTAFVAGRRIYRTGDAGETWTALGLVDPDPSRVVIALAMSSTARSTLFAATACLADFAASPCPPVSVVWRSTNSGQTWTQMSVVGGYVRRFAIDPRMANRVYAAIAGVAGDLLVSTNGGAAWVSALGNLPRTSVNTVVIDLASLPPLFTQPAQNIYIGTDDGVFVSFDAGTRWMDASAGLPASPVTDLALLQPDGIVIAGTAGRGVYQASLTEIAAGLVVFPLAQRVTVAQGSAADIGLAVTNLSTSSTIDWQLTALDSWISVSQSSGSMRPLGLAQVVVAVSAAGLRIGIHVGRLELTSDFGVQKITLIATVTAAPAQMLITSGNNAGGLPGASLPPLQVVMLDAAQAPLPGVPVTFTITSGGGSLNDREVFTDASGAASVILTLPQKPGRVEVTADSGAFSVTFVATAFSAPTLLTDSILNAVTFNPNTSFAPGSILAIAGQHLASTAAFATESLPAALETTRVFIGTANGDVALPLFSVSPSMITALMPFGVAAGTYLLRAEVGSLRSNAVEIRVAAFDPGIFTVNGSGRGSGLFIKDDGSIVTAANPADRGARVSFYAAGLGDVSPALDAGQPGSTIAPFNRTTLAPAVFFDRFAATVSYSGLAPGIAGRYLVTVQVPPLVSPATNISVSLTIGGYTSNRVTIPVR